MCPSSSAGNARNNHYRAIFGSNQPEILGYLDISYTYIVCYIDTSSQLIIIKLKWKIVGIQYSS